jgi:hypothetical protein
LSIICQPEDRVSQPSDNKAIASNHWSCSEETTLGWVLVLMP